jgi:hypothetical protein
MHRLGEASGGRLKAAGPIWEVRCAAGSTMPVPVANIRSLWFAGALILMWELSTPFVNARAIMAALHVTDGAPYIVNGLLMVFSFFWARVVYGTYRHVQQEPAVGIGLHHACGRAEDLLCCPVPPPPPSFCHLVVQLLHLLALHA